MRRIEGVVKALPRPMDLPTFPTPIVISAMVNAYRSGYCEHILQSSGNVERLFECVFNTIYKMALEMKMATAL